MNSTFLNTYEELVSLKLINPDDFSILETTKSNIDKGEYSYFIDVLGFAKVTNPSTDAFDFGHMGRFIIISVIEYSYQISFDETNYEELTWVVYCHSHHNVLSYHKRFSSKDDAYAFVKSIKLVGHADLSVVDMIATD